MPNSRLRQSLRQGGWGALEQTRESTSRIKTFKNFQEKKSIRPNFAAEGIHGGPLLSARSAEFICFYDWAECRVIRRIDVAVKDIWWAESGELVSYSQRRPDHTRLRLIHHLPPSLTPRRPPPSSTAVFAAQVRRRT